LILQAKFEKKKLTQRFVCVGEDIPEEPNEDVFLPQTAQTEASVITSLISERKSSTAAVSSVTDRKSLQTQKQQQQQHQKLQTPLLETVDSLYENLQHIPIAAVNNEIYYPPTVWDDKITSYRPLFKFEARSSTRVCNVPCA
jgi:hypothetical protein